MLIVVNALFVVTYVALIYFSYRKYGLTLLPYYYLVFFQFWCLISVCYIDTGIYNPELFRETYTSFATVYLSLLYFVFHVFFIVGFQFFSKLKGANRVDVVQYGSLFRRYMPIYGVIIFLISLASVMLIINKIGLNIVEDRALYNRTLSSLERIFVKYSEIIAFSLGLFAIARRKYMFSAVTLALVVVYFIMSGNKYSVFMALFFSFSFPLATLTSSAKISRKAIFFVLAFFALAIGVAVYRYYLSELDFGYAMTMLKNRLLAGQGAIWWGAIDFYVESGNADLGQLFVEFNYLQGVGSPHEVGMQNLMVDILGVEVAMKIIDRGFLYTMAFPANYIAMAPLAAVALVMVIWSLIFSFLVSYIVSKIRRQEYLRAILAYAILSPLITFFFTGAIFVIVSFGVLIKIGLLFLVESIGSPQQLRSILGGCRESNSSIFQKV